MTPKALKALKSSIRKWEKIVLGTGEEKGVTNCALCKLFDRATCRGCPVRAVTGQDHCKGTPYINYIGAEKTGWAGTYPTNAAGVFHARRMLDFLRDLLPCREKQTHFKIAAE